MIGVILVLIEGYGGLLRLAAVFNIRFEVRPSQIFNIFAAYAGEGL